MLLPPSHPSPSLSPGPADCAPKCPPHLFSAPHRSAALLRSPGREAPTWLPSLQSDPLQFIFQPQGHLRKHESDHELPD